MSRRQLPSGPGSDLLEQLTHAQRQRRWKRAMLVFDIAFLSVPVILAVLYLYIFATNSYQVNTVWAIRNPSAANSGSSAGSMIGGMMAGSSGGGATTMERAVDESYAVVNYIQSRVAFDELSKRLNLRGQFTSPTIDWWSRLSPRADYEKAYDYYLGKISIYYDEIEGEVNLSTHAYTPEMAYEMAKDLAEISETIINQFNERAQEDAITLARQQLSQSDRDLRSSIQAVTAYQLSHNLLDPNTASSDSNGVLTTLREQAAEVRSQISALSETARATGPRLTELRNKMAGLDSQAEAEQARMTGHTNSFAPLIGEFKLLTINEALAQSQYTTAATMLQADLLQAERQKLYVVNIVPAVVPPESTEPRRLRDLLIVAAAVLTLWVIARLAIAAIRDHYA